MVMSCVAYKCNNLHNKNSNIQFHGFPFKRPEILALWINSIKRIDWTPTKSSKLCSVHFLDTDCQGRPGASVKILKPEAVPSIFHFPVHMIKENANQRILKRCLDSNDNTEPPLKIPKIETQETSTALTKEAATQTSFVLDANNALKKKIKALNVKVRRRNNKISSMSQLLNKINNSSL